MLLKSLIFHYHGLDPDEEELLAKAAEKYDSESELTWANNFISEDYMSAFERAKEFLSKTVAQLDDNERLAQLQEVWEETNAKGYATEMETTALINLAKDWKVASEFLSYLNH